MCDQLVVVLQNEDHDLFIDQESIEWATTLYFGRRHVGDGRSTSCRGGAGRFTCMCM
jgi:hypothetical protein